MMRFRARGSFGSRLTLLVLLIAVSLLVVMPMETQARFDVEAGPDGGGTEGGPDGTGPGATNTEVPRLVFHILLARMIWQLAQVSL